MGGGNNSESYYSHWMLRYIADYEHLFTLVDNKQLY